MTFPFYGNIEINNKIETVKIISKKEGVNGQILCELGSKEY